MQRMPSNNKKTSPQINTAFTTKDTSLEDKTPILENNLISEVNTKLKITKKVSPSHKLIKRICLHYLRVIKKNAEHKLSQQLNISSKPTLDRFGYPLSQPQLEIFDDYSPQFSSLTAGLKFIFSQFLKWDVKVSIEELNAILYLMMKNIDRFQESGYMLTKKNIFNIMKVSFMLSHKTYLDNPLVLSDYAWLLYGNETTETRKYLLRLEQEFLIAINYKLPLSSKKIRSIFKIPSITLFSKVDDSCLQLLIINKKPKDYELKKLFPAPSIALLPSHSHLTVFWLSMNEYKKKSFVLSEVEDIIKEIAHLETNKYYPVSSQPNDPLLALVDKISAKWSEDQKFVP